MRILPAGMCRTTPKSRASSHGCEKALVLEPSRSRWLLSWWLALHLVVLAAIGVANLPALVKVAAGIMLLAHGFLCAPRRATRLVRRADGSWEYPARRLLGLRLTRDTSYTALWVRLVFSARGARALTILLLRDQLDAVSWRRLQADLRRGST